MTSVVIALIALHSMALGAGMMLFARPFLQAFGFPPEPSLFYPTQSGLFLLILGVCYALAVRDRALAPVIVVSKAGAVVFLFAEVLWGGAPPIIWGAGFGDLGMLVTVLALLKMERARQPA